MAPIHRRAQRLSARQGIARAAGQKPEAVAQTISDLLDRHHPDARCRQLDRQRDAIQVAADPRYRRCVLSREHEARAHLAGALDEQPHRIGLAACVELGWLGLRQERERRHAPIGLSREPERRPARGQNDQMRTALEQGFGRPRRRLEQMLAIVKHDQCPARSEMGATRLQRRHPRQRTDPEGRGQRVAQQLGLGQRRQVDPPSPVGVVAQTVGHRLQCETGLSTAARARQRQQPRLPDRLAQLPELSLTPNEARQQLRQVVRRRTERGQRSVIDRHRASVPSPTALRPAHHGARCYARSAGKYPGWAM